MMMRFSLCALYVLTILSPIGVYAESLDQFISSVKAANLDLRSARKQAEAESARARAAGYWDDPFFGVGPDEVPESDRSAGMMRYQLSQAIPFPGRLSARKGSAFAQARLAEASATSAERELTVVAALMYARAYYTQNAINVNREQQKLLSELLSSTKSRYRTGVGDHHELILAQVEISSLDAEHLRLNRELKVLKARMNEMKATAPDVPVELESIAISSAVPESFGDAIEQQPEMLATNAGLEAAQSEVRSAKLAYFPDIVLQGMYMKPRMTSTNEMGEPAMESASWGAMVGISIPLFFFGKQANLSSAAQLSREAASAQREAIENRLRTEWVEAEAQLKTAEDLVRLYKNDVVPNTELAARTGRSAYVARRFPLSQYLEILRVQHTQSLELAAAEIDVSMAKMRKIYLLSRAPQMRLAPMRPTLFGGAGMGDGMSSGMSDSASSSINMGSGMRSPVLKPNSRKQDSGGSSGMEGM